MEIHMWQIIALTLLAFFAICENLSTSVLANQPVIIGTIAGIIMGDMKMGLAVGATLQLMILGVGTYGGASMPDYMTGSIIGTVFAVTSGKGMDFGIGLAVPVGLLMVQLDVLARFSNVFFANRVEAAVDRMDFKAIGRNTWLGSLSWGLSRALPVFLMLIFGQNLVNVIVDYMPEWLMGGLSVAGGLLPAVGIAILLRYLPVKNYISYLLIGFFAAAYLSVPMVGVAILGVALAVIAFKQCLEKSRQTVAVNTRVTQEGLLDGEFED
jgi:PTS system mannose-specific IIC component